MTNKSLNTLAVTLFFMLHVHTLNAMLFKRDEDRSAQITREDIRKELLELAGSQLEEKASAARACYEKGELALLWNDQEPSYTHCVALTASWAVVLKQHAQGLRTIDGMYQMPQSISRPHSISCMLHADDTWFVAHDGDIARVHAITYSDDSVPMIHGIGHYLPGRVNSMQYEKETQTIIVNGKDEGDSLKPYLAASRALKCTVENTRSTDPRISYTKWLDWTVLRGKGEFSDMCSTQGGDVKLSEKDGKGNAIVFCYREGMKSLEHVMMATEQEDKEEKKDK